MQIAHWKEALILARQSVSLSNPNPRVGCIIISPGGQLLGQGHTQRAGEPHAENAHAIIEADAELAALSFTVMN